MSRASGRNGGFVLTDALASVFLLSISVAGILGGVGIVREQARASAHKATALVLARGCVEASTTKTGSVDRDVDGDRYTIYQSVRKDERKRESGPVIWLSTRSCVVSWSVGGQRRQLSLERVDLAAS